MDSKPSDVILEVLNSPQLTSSKKKMIDHEIKVQDEHYDNTWDSCCLTMDKRAVVFFFQMFIISGVMVFNIIQLIRLQECAHQVPYMSLLTFLIGVLIPNPKISQS